MKITLLQPEIVPYIIKWSSVKGYGEDECGIECDGKAKGVKLKVGESQPYDPCKYSVVFFIKKYQGISKGFEIQPLPKRFHSPFLQNWLCILKKKISFD